MWNTALSRPSSSPHLMVWVPPPVVFRGLASLLSIKREELYSKTILFIRCQLGFALLRSAARCLRGSRSTFTPDLANTKIDLALSEGRVSYLLFSLNYLMAEYTIHVHVHKLSRLIAIA